ncbi:MAG TPA: hypothetical protein VM910_29445 [Bradyrhizobium sp.]|jgi:hypothetical protein|nr:hypothetical protein [Bradyrhizobium sp.]
MHTSKVGERQQGAKFARGGRDHMFPKQGAGAAPAGRAAKRQPAPVTPRAAKGGGKSNVGGVSRPAVGGRTSPPR